MTSKEVEKLECKLQMAGYEKRNSIMSFVHYTFEYVKYVRNAKGKQIYGIHFGFKDMREIQCDAPYTPEWTCSVKVIAGDSNARLDGDIYEPTATDYDLMAVEKFAQEFYNISVKYERRNRQ